MSKKSDDFFKKYSLEEIQGMPVLHQGQFDDLLLENEEYRLWRSRMTVNAGAPYNDQVTIEKLVSGRWETVSQYRPKPKKKTDGD